MLTTMEVLLRRRAGFVRSWRSLHSFGSSPTSIRSGRRTLSNAAIIHPNTQPRHETTCFEYLRDVPLYHHEKPFSLVQPWPEALKERRTSNLVWERPAPELIIDIRGQESKYELDKHGFAVRHSPTKLSQCDFDDPDIIEHLYLPEISNLLKTTVEGADMVVNTHFQV